MKMFVGHPSAKNRNLMDPRVPLMSGVVQNQDSYMKGKIAQRKYYDRVLPTLKSVMDEYGRLTGRKYDVVMTYRLEDADYAIVGSGSMMETAEAAVDYIREHMGVKVGLLHITSFRPFPSIEIVEALRHVKAIAVLERLDIPMMQSNPQLAEIKAAFADAHPHRAILRFQDRGRRLRRIRQPRCARDHRRRRQHVEQEPQNILHTKNQARFR